MPISRRRIFASTLDLPADGLHTALDRLVEAGVDGFHLDVADGRFVERRAGSVATARILAETGLPFDIHLMVARPSKIAAGYAKTGPRVVYLHVECGPDELHRAVERLGPVDAGLALRVETPLDAVEPYLGAIDSLLLLGVPAGRGGQPMDPSAPVRLTEAAARYPRLERCHDGGLTLVTKPLLDAPLLVAGRVLATSPDLKGTLAALRA